MSKQNKWAGNFGKVASGGSSTQGGNGSKGVSKVAAPVAKSSKSQNVIDCETGPGENNGNTNSSSHNSINTFTRGIKSRGPYTGPSFSSMNNSETYMKQTDTSLKSGAKHPSSGVGLFTVGNSGSTGGNKGSGPVGGPSFRSISNSHKIMQGSNPSKFTLPSQVSQRAGGSTGTGMTKAPNRTGSGRANATRQSSPKSNKDGSGYQASVR